MSELPRYIDEHERRRLRAATVNALNIAQANLFAERTRVKAGALSKYGNDHPDNADNFMPIDIAVELDRHNGAPLMISAAAGLLGFRLVPLEDQEPSALGAADALSVSKETGEVVNLLLTLISQGKPLDAAARRELLKETGEAIQTLFNIASKAGA